MEHDASEFMSCFKDHRKEFPGLVIKRIMLTFDSALSIGGEERAEH